MSITLGITLRDILVDILRAILMDISTLECWMNINMSQGGSGDGSLTHSGVSYGIIQRINEKVGQRTVP